MCVVVWKETMQSTLQCSLSCKITFSISQESKHSLILKPLGDPEDGGDSFRLLCSILDVGAEDMGRYELRVSDDDGKPVGKMDMWLYVRAQPVTQVVCTGINNDRTACLINAYLLHQTILF